MRNVIFAINTTLDGCVDHTKQVADDETHEYFTDLLREVDLHLWAYHLPIDGSFLAGRRKKPVYDKSIE